ncbi:hypothetical protein L195_g064399, partial [Trifolium pratense]
MAGDSGITSLGASGIIIILGL